MPSLKRIDGFDIYLQALDEADRVLKLFEAPDGYIAAHRFIGEDYGDSQFQELRSTRGSLVIQDYLKPRPATITNTLYDLVTEYGGIGELETNQQFKDIVKLSASALQPGGSMMFVNFLEKEIPELERKLGRHTPNSLSLDKVLFEQAVTEAGLHMREFHAINNPEGIPIMQTFFYGYANKS